MSRLDDIEREAKERRTGNYVGRNTWGATQAEAAVDELVAMVREESQAVEDWKEKHQQARAARDKLADTLTEMTAAWGQARADVKKLRESIIREDLTGTRNFRDVLAETDREEYR